MLEKVNVTLRGLPVIRRLQPHLAAFLLAFY
jgi:hypothetical protein